MSSFLFVMWEGGGTVPPLMAVAHRLVRRGHRAHVLADPTIEPEARAAGCDFTAWERAPHRTTRTKETDLMRDWETKNPLTMLRRARDVMIGGPAAEYAADVLTTVERTHFDALAVDAVLFGALVGAERSGVPTAALFPNLYPFPDGDATTLSTGFATARGPLGRARDRITARVVRRALDGSLPAVNRARADLGLEPLAHLADQVQRADRVLMLTSRFVDRPMRLPDHVVYAGAETDDPAWATPWTSPFAAENDDPLVLVGMSSTYQAQEDALHRVVEALRVRKVRAVVTLGPALPNTRIDAPPHVAVVGSVPHSQVLREAAALITHCGHGTTVKGLAAGVPIVCLPMGRDQVDNAQRVAELGAGIRLSRKAAARKIGAALDAVLIDPTYRTAARGLAERMAGEARPDLAVHELEQLANTSADRP